MPIGDRWDLAPWQTSDCALEAGQPRPSGILVGRSAGAAHAHFTPPLRLGAQRLGERDSQHLQELWGKEPKPCDSD